MQSRNAAITQYSVRFKPRKKVLHGATDRLVGFLRFLMFNGRISRYTSALESTAKAGMTGGFVLKEKHQSTKHLLTESKRRLTRLEGSQSSLPLLVSLPVNPFLTPLPT